MNRLGLIGGKSVKLPAQPVRVLGIDLGTTNSTVSEVIWDPAAPENISARCVDLEQETLQGNYSHVLVPSIVAIHGTGTLVGEGAKRLRGQGLRKDQSIFYECKNDIGLGKTYHRAPEGFQSAVEIGGKVLEFLRDAALREDDTPIERIVVTVPASFQANQRRDTVAAAHQAGMELGGGECLDEPVAAFIDHLMTKGQELLEELTTPKTLIVFDFGGGTCDVALFRLERSSDDDLRVSTLAVSRYHRLGGGDIDTAIVHEVLLPQLREQNDLTEFDLGFTEKKMVIEPALLGVAEQLKIGLSDEIRRLQTFGVFDESDKSQVIKTAPGGHKLKVGERELTLVSPKLTAADFETLLEPFFDQDLLYARETDYRMTCSIFAPLKDVLDRSGLGERDVDLCLLVGGSSLIPQVVAEVDEYFRHATVLTPADRDSVKACISRGAAYHALSLVFREQGFIRQMCHDDIAIRTGNGLLNLVPQGAVLPYPADKQFEVCKAIGIPETVGEGESVDVRVELLTGSDDRRLYTEVWKIEGPAREGAPLSLQYRLDENQVLELKLARADGGDSVPLQAELDKPLTNVVNPQNKRLQALEIEEHLKTSNWSKSKMVREMRSLADLYADLGQPERAVSTLLAALRLHGAADEYLLNKLGMVCGELGDFEREERFYCEAGDASSWNGPWFNLALSKKRQGKITEAIESLERGLAKERDAPDLVLRAMLADAQKDVSARDDYLNEAVTLFDSPSSLSDWELGWFVTGMRMVGDESQLAEGHAEVKRRHRGDAPEMEAGKLPKKISDSQEND